MTDPRHLGLEAQLRAGGGSLNCPRRKKLQLLWPDLAVSLTSARPTDALTDSFTIVYLFLVQSGMDIAATRISGISSVYSHELLTMFFARTGLFPQGRANGS